MGVINCVTENRAGKFRIRFEVLNNDPEIVAFVLSHVVVYHADEDFRSHMIEYHAYSSKFDKTDPDTTVPEYQVTVDCQVGKNGKEIYSALFKKIGGVPSNIRAIKIRRLDAEI
jgi:hypothetical protein